jgi:hypothetical protein
MDILSFYLCTTLITQQLSDMAAEETGSFPVDACLASGAAGGRPPCSLEIQTPILIFGTPYLQLFVQNLRK